MDHCTMNKLAIFVQTHLLEKDATVELITSLRKHNIDSLPLFVSVHNGEQGVFSAELPHVTAIFEDATVFDSLLVNRQLRLQSMRLNLHKLGLAENWLIFAPGSNIHTDFKIKDFFTYADHLRYYVDIKKDYDSYTELLRTIRLPHPVYHTKTNPWVWSSSVLELLEITLEKEHLTVDKVLALADSRNISDIEGILYSSIHEYRFPYINMEPYNG